MRVSLPTAPACSSFWVPCRVCSPDCRVKGKVGCNVDSLQFKALAVHVTAKAAVYRRTDQGICRDEKGFCSE
jgi:hypothetical protein